MACKQSLPDGAFELKRQSIYLIWVSICFIAFALPEMYNKTYLTT